MNIISIYIDMYMYKYRYVKCICICIYMDANFENNGSLWSYITNSV